MATRIRSMKDLDILAQDICHHLAHEAVNGGAEYETVEKLATIFDEFKANIVRAASGSTRIHRRGNVIFLGATVWDQR